MGKACMFMTLLTDLYKIFLAEMQDNAFGWVRLWVSTKRWKKCPTFNKSWGILSWQVVCPFFAKLFWLVYGSASFPDWVPRYHLSSQATETREVGWFFSPRQIDASHPAVTTPASFSSWLPERSEHCGNKDAVLLLKLCPIVLVSCHCGRQHLLTPVNYRRGTPYLLKSLCQDAVIFNPWPCYVMIIINCTGVINAQKLLAFIFTLPLLTFLFEQILRFINHQEQFKQSTLKLPQVL